MEFSLETFLWSSQPTKRNKIPKSTFGWEAVHIKSQINWQYKRKFKKAMATHTSKQSPKSIWGIFPLKRSSIKLDGCLRQKNGCYWAQRKQVSQEDTKLSTFKPNIVVVVGMCILCQGNWVHWLNICVSRNYYKSNIIAARVISAVVTCNRNIDHWALLLCIWNISFVIQLCRIAKPFEFKAMIEEELPWMSHLSPRPSTYPTMDITARDRV